jgi:putative transposase
MPRQARIDAPGALHHVIIRGIEKRDIFKDDQDRNNFLKRLGNILLETSTACYAWALIPNHVHLLLRSGVVPIATVMRRLLTGYAQQFNRRYRRHGQLFQNRYKSVLCEEDPYLIQLVRYIHLNPLRAGLVRDLKGLQSYRYAGHAVLMGSLNCEWQAKEYVLKLFGKMERRARTQYASFVARGVNEGRRPELVGGGLLRSIGGWSSLKIRLLQGIRIKGDERILGSGDFVERVLKGAHEDYEQRTRLKRQGYDWEGLLQRVAGYYKLDENSLRDGRKEREAVKVRSVLCYLAVRKLRMSATEVALKLNITPSAVSKLVPRGESIVHITGVEDFSVKC